MWRTCCSFKLFLKEHFVFSRRLKFLFKIHIQDSRKYSYIRRTVLFTNDKNTFAEPLSLNATNKWFCEKLVTVLYLIVDIIVFKTARDPFVLSLILNETDKEILPNPPKVCQDLSKSICLMFSWFMSKLDLYGFWEKMLSKMRVLPYRSHFRKAH